MKSGQVVKKYKSYPGPQKCGIRCKFNSISGRYPLHKHDYIEIEYLVLGKTEHELNGVISVMQPGDFVCLSQRDLHRFRVIEPAQLRNIGIDYRYAPSAVRQMLQTLSFPMTGSINAGTMAQLEQWFVTLINLSGSDEAYCEEKITAYTLLLLSGILENSIAKPAKKLTGGYRYVSSAMDYMAQHYGEDISLEDVANAVSLSAGHFSKLFSKINGVSFSEYLTALRIQKARYALAYTDKSVTEIAFECGFGSFSTFSRNFKRLCGYTPTSYRSDKE